MCGFGVWVGPGSASDGVAALRAMHRAIPHRGPDGEGFLVLQPGGDVHVVATEDALPRGPIVAGIAFRRLGVMDPRPEAGQPMGNSDGSVFVAFNGEIYNFAALRSQLAADGRSFRTSGDTEVLLAAYERWGEECFSRLEGMWAAAILDLKRRRLLLTRDRFGIKPLYWTVRDGALLAASEVKQILPALAGRPAPNRNLVEMFLRGARYPFVEETFFAGVRGVPPATWASLSLDEPPRAPVFREYWRLSDHVCERPDAVAYPDAVDRVEECLTRAVASHAVADVAVGALLSGGLDSSTIVALLSRKLGRPLPTFSFGFREAAPDFCEMPYADAVASAAGVENHETTFDAAWVEENLEEVIRALEEPPMAMPALAQYRVFQLAAERGMTVVLDGQGADEIAAGYVYHQRFLLRDRLLHGRWLAGLRELRAIAAREGRSSVRVAHALAAPYLRRRAPPDWVAPAPPRADAAEFAVAARDFGRDRARVNRATYFDVRWGNAKIILGYADRSAMAHSLEARVPYFDRAFVELLFQLPDHFKIGGGDRKRVLRDVARRYVPAVVTERADRMGFGVPMQSLLRGRIESDVESALLEGSLLDSGTVVPQALRRLVREYREGRADAWSVWRPYALAKWARVYDVSW